MSMNNMCVQPNVIGQKLATAKGTPVTKYMAQSNPNISNINQTPCMSTVQYRSNENLQAGEQRVTTYRTIQPTEARPSSAVNKSVTVINHPMHINPDSSSHQPTKKNSEWNQLYVFPYIIALFFRKKNLFVTISVNNCFLFIRSASFHIVAIEMVWTLVSMSSKVLPMRVQNLQRFQVPWTMSSW